jgi:uncharacterized protein
VNVEVVDNPDKRRFEALVDGEVAGFAFYQQRDGALIVVHTEVGERWEGQGVGSKLAAGTLDQIRARGLRMRPICPFISAYVQRHPEYADLVAES